MELLMFLFKSGLPLEEISATSEKRADRYRKVKGLIQKYYVQDKSTGHVGGACMHAYGKYKLTREAGEKYDLQLKKETVEKIKLGFELRSGLAIDKKIEEKKLSIVTLYSKKVIPKLANYTQLLLKDLEERISEHYKHTKESTEDLQMVVLVTLS